MVKHIIIVVAGPDRGACNDPEALEVALHHDDPTFINALAGTRQNHRIFYTLQI